jgi:hypothetical protein
LKEADTMLKQITGVVLLGAALAACNSPTDTKHAASLDAYQRFYAPGARGAMSMQDMIDMGYVGTAKLGDCVNDCDSPAMIAQQNAVPKSNPTAVALRR